MSQAITHRIQELETLRDLVRKAKKKLRESQRPITIETPYGDVTIMTVEDKIAIVEGELYDDAGEHIFTFDGLRVVLLDGSYRVLLSSRLPQSTRKSTIIHRAICKAVAALPATPIRSPPAGNRLVLQHSPIPRLRNPTPIIDPERIPMLRWLHTLWTYLTTPTPRQRSPQPASDPRLPRCILVRLNPDPLVLTARSDPDVFTALRYLSRHSSASALTAHDLAATLDISRLAAAYARRWWCEQQSPATDPEAVPF